MVQKGVLYVGFDESNHGRYPEIFTLAFTSNNFYASIKPSAPPKLLISKLRSKNKNPLEKLKKNIDYSFLIWDDQTQSKFSRKDIQNKKEKMLGYICASLLFEKINIIKNKGDLEDICLFVDGEKTCAEKGYIREIISDISDLSPSKIHVQDGGDLDRRCKIVSISDSIAYFIHRKIVENKQISANVLFHKKPLLWDLVN